MKKKILSVALIIIMSFSLTLPAFSAESADTAGAADKLYTLGLFQGVGTNTDGTPIFDLDRAPTRAEAITMFVRLLGKDNEAKSGTWTIPFTDVPEWAKPYVGYAYENGLTLGTSSDTFGSGSDATVSQYLTFVLRALGYSSDTDFAWNKAWELSDKLGFTSGEYSEGTSDFTRGNVAVISLNALSAIDKATGKALYVLLIENGAITQDNADSVGLATSDPATASPALPVEQPAAGAGGGFKLTLINEDPSSGILKAYVAEIGIERFDPDTATEIISGGHTDENNRVRINISDIPANKRIRDVMINDISFREGFLIGAYGFIAMSLSSDTTVRVTFEDVPAVLPELTGVTVFSDSDMTTVLSPGAVIKLGDTIYSKPVYSGSGDIAFCVWEYADSEGAEEWTEVLWWHGHYQCQTANNGINEIDLTGKYIRARMTGLDKHSTGEAISSVYLIKAGS